MDNNKDSNNKANNISEIICDRIAQLRKRDKLSQEALAGMLGITFQAVSKWENNVSCPDISIIPDIARIFNVSVGYLFGEEAYDEGILKEDLQESSENNTGNTFEGKSMLECDWENDNIIRVVVARGHRLIKSHQLDEKIKENVTVNLSSNINGSTINSQLGIVIENEISNSTLTAGGNIICGDIADGGSMSSGGNISCGDIADAGTMTAGGNISCGDITDVGAMTSGGNISCGDISEGSITSQGNIECRDINASGTVSAGICISCGDINDCSDVSAGNSINCGDIYDCENIHYEGNNE